MRDSRLELQLIISNVFFAMMRSLPLVCLTNARGFPSAIVDLGWDHRWRYRHMSDAAERPTHTSLSQRDGAASRDTSYCAGGLGQRWL